MNEDKGIMKYESVLPADFNGVFMFTNPSDAEFVGKWGGKEYHFPAESTSPMIMTEFSPLEVQHIRKKFARDLAEREFFKSSGYRTLSDQEGKPGNRTMNSFQHAAAYTISELTPYIQQCLVPLPEARAAVTNAPKVKLEEVLSRNDDGELNTEAIDQKTSLRKRALETQ